MEIVESNIVWVFEKFFEVWGLTASNSFESLASEIACWFEVEVEVGQLQNFFPNRLEVLCKFV